MDSAKTDAPMVERLAESTLSRAMLALDVSLRPLLARRRDDKEAAAIAEALAELRGEVSRRALVDLLTGKNTFDGDAAAAFRAAVERARGAGLLWPDIVAIVNTAGEAGR